MPELQSCYFCGEIGDALTAFDVVPAHLADESTQRTVVVCSTCHRKLDTLLAPLRTLAGGGDVGAVSETAGTDDTDRSSIADDADQPVDAESPLAPSDWDEESADDATVGSSDDDTESDEITFADTATESDDTTGETADETSGETDTGIAFSDTDPGRTDGTEESTLGGSDEDATDEPAGELGESADDPKSEAATASDDSAGEAATASDESTEETTVEPSDEPPTGYRKVVRLLQNREFPVERESFVELASNAYELDEADVSASLDRLVDRGALVASDGQLQKP